MYEAFYGFREKPFNLTPDPKFLYLSAKHNEAFAHLEFGLKQRGGFMVISGEVGTGKTTLCRYFLDRLDDDTVSAFILYPALGTEELLRSINGDLGIETDGTTAKELIDSLHRFLLESRRANKNTVLVIDEAQNLSRNVLEQVRLISNLETDTEKLIQIVLIGQSELNDMLAQNDLRQLAQRVTARYHLAPLSREEMTHYIRHRLAVAGGIGRVDFDPGALRVIHRFSKGVPRLINLLCDRSLLAGYVLGVHDIDAKIVKRAVKELTTAQGRRPWYRRKPWLKVASVAVGATLLGSVSFAYLRKADAFKNAGTLVAGWTDWGGHRSSSGAPVSGPEEGEGRASEKFELRLVTLSESLSRRAATAVLLELWDIHLGGGVSALSVLEDMPSLADRAALNYLELDTSLEQVRALNMPVVLELFHESRDDELFVTLTGLKGDWAEVSFAPGDAGRVPVEALEKFWTGKVRLFWRDFEHLRSAEAAEKEAWARERLARLGMLSSAADGAGDLQKAIKALQEKAFMSPTGLVGDETSMALYSFSEDYQVPHLVEP